MISSSDGDERETFLKCVESCLLGKSASDPAIDCDLNLVLKLTGWDCPSDCKYRCMRHDLQLLRSQNSPIVQYYGKWPFKRVLGAQEIFSVIFSVGNLFACLYGYFLIYSNARVKSKSKSNSYDLVYFVGLLITCNCWLQSAIFHYRDTWLTEKLDYFSACLCILYTLPTAIIRVFEIKNPGDQIKIVLPVLLAYLQHVYYMSFINFDYGYNIKFNAAFGVASNSLWLYFALKKNNRSALRFVILNVLSMVMVAVDFPPLVELIDMHALWHLSTIPITLLWYKFIRSLN